MLIIQDVLYLQSKGGGKMPKFHALGLILKYLTGSSKIVDLVSKLGYCVSNSTVIALVIALAQLQLNQGVNGILRGFTERKLTILVWDNIDFSEETLSEAGTVLHLTPME